MKIFAAEKEIEELLLKNRSVAYLSELLLQEDSEEGEKSLASLLNKTKATNERQIDLHYLKTVLVSTGWNKNDDVFAANETWAARKTPEDKPFNFEHNEKDIIGHITGNYVVDDKGNVLADDTDVKDLPGRFHIITNAVLYAHWTDEELKERMESILKDITQGKWFVSMEALFDGFDYAVQEASGKQRVVARDEQSAFLTKHLRCYGGTGEYQGYRIGRLLRNIVFSGKGLVRKPANPDSIIFQDVKPFGGVLESVVDAAAPLNKESDNFTLLNTAANDKKETSKSLEQERKMSVDVESLTKQVEALTKERNELHAKLREFDEQKIRAEIDALKHEIKVRDEKVAAVEKSVEAIRAAKAEVDAARVEAEKAKVEAEENLKKANDELAKIKAEEVKRARIAALVEAGLDAQEAAAKYEKFASVDDETFAGVIELAKSAYMKKEEKKEEEDKKKKKDDKAKAGEDVLENLETDTSDPDLTAGNPSEMDEVVAQLVEVFESEIFHATASKK